MGQGHGLGLEWLLLGWGPWGWRWLTWCQGWHGLGLELCCCGAQWALGARRTLCVDGGWGQGQRMGKGNGMGLERLLISCWGQAL